MACQNCVQLRRAAANDPELWRGSSVVCEACETLLRLIKEVATWKRSHKSLRRKLRNSLAEEKRLRTHGGSDL